MTGVNEYKMALARAIAEFYKDFREMIKSEWNTVPDISLEQIYRKINQFLKRDLTLEEHLRFIKQLHKLGYITYKYGGISIVRGQEAEKHWIEVRSPLFKLIKQFAENNSL